MCYDHPHDWRREAMSDMSENEKVAENIYEISCGCGSLQCKDCADMWRAELKKALDKLSREKEELSAQLERARLALKPFAELSDPSCVAPKEFMMAWYVKAKEALTALKEKENK